MAKMNWWRGLLAGLLLASAVLDAGAETTVSAEFGVAAGGSIENSEINVLQWSD